MPKKINIIVSRTCVRNSDVFITEKELEILRGEQCKEQDLIQAKVLTAAKEVPDNECDYDHIETEITLDDGELIFDV